MRRIKQVACVLLAGVALVGCASPQPKLALSDAERQQIKEGKLIKYSQKYINPTLDSMKIALLGTVELQKGSSIYVCATADLIVQKCLPHVSTKLAQYFTEQGVKVMDSPAAANKEVFILLSYNYQGAVMNPDQLPTLENSLAKDGSLDIGAEDQAADKKRQEEQIKADKKNFLETLVGVAAIVAIGGGNSIQSSGSASTALQSQHIAGDVDNRKKLMYLRIMTKSAGDTFTMPITDASYVYEGPVDLRASFAPLLDEAMKDTAERLVVN